jgi:hypothetical protein
MRHHARALSYAAMFDWFDPSLEQQILERRLFDFSPNTQALFFSPVVWIDNGENAEVAPIGGKSETRLGNRPGHVKRTCRYVLRDTMSARYNDGDNHCASDT